MNSAPSFSIVICNHNYAHFIATAIRSALDQDYPADRVEVIVVDDGSTDTSRDIIARFAGEPRMHSVLQENRGQSAAYAAGVAVAVNDYVCLLDSDDVYAPHKLSRVAERIATIGGSADELFLCHDLRVEDTSSGKPVDFSWFDIVGVKKLGDQYTTHQPAMNFPFSIPCGLVFSRPLIAACLEALPTWAFTRGTDGVLCPAAFLKAGTVHYLHKMLGTYRVHGRNEFASLVDGRYVPRFNWRVRTPKTLQFLERWLDAIDQPAAQRAIGLTYLQRLEHLGRKPSASRGLGEPLVSVAIVGDSRDAVNASAKSASLQSHEHVEVAIPSAFASLVEVDTPSASWHIFPDDAADDDIERLAHAYAATSGEYVVFLRAGDRLDREYVERHLFWRQHGALVAASCCDIRLASQAGALSHAGVFANSGVWSQPLQQIPPLAIALNDWVAAPLSACMFRRNAFLDRFFALAPTMPDALRRAGPWLLFQMQLHLGGALRIRETLASISLTDGAGASYAYLAAPAAIDGELLLPPIAEAAHWLHNFYADEASLFRRWLSPAWHQRFGQWINEQTPSRQA